ncbi:unnamed protein product [Kluyveromyces dobzhanskii CBS 2104]|uniref:WGS project CCBQ000000000 data, contig 00028 n=1 Tax=Kluyveromyces dobzhanskii CBS 2104 TaxID=1427455 RepID=A0A0A8KYW3_9SACH|nr:unnamed protein product [Kluyveromyces dobzhanskii CBS 2104]
MSSDLTDTETTPRNKGTLVRNFSWWSLIGLSFSLTNSWLGVSSSFVVGLAGAGPPLVIYGLIFAFVLTSMCGYSLSEFSYLLPNSAGTSFWTLTLLETSTPNDSQELPIVESESSAIKYDVKESLSSDLKNEKDVVGEECHFESKKHASRIQKNMAIMVGMINYFGCLFTTASISSSLVYSIMGIHSLLNPSFVFKQWHNFLLYEIITIFLTAFNCHFQLLPLLSTFGFTMSLFTYAFTFVVCLVSRSDTISEQPWPKSQDIFQKFNNNTGWKSDGMAFLVGLINPLWSFVGIDSATHMTDEVGRTAAKVLVPKVITATIIIGFVTSFSYSIALFYCVRDTTAVLDSIAPAVTIYYQATANKNLAILLQTCTIVVGLTCGVASGTWQSRTLWALSRDMQAWKSKNTMSHFMTAKLAIINPACKVPLNAHLFSQLLVVIIGCIMLGSTKAFNAIISAAVTLLIISYAIPSAILLTRGREKFIRKHGGQIQDGRSLTSKCKQWLHRFGWVPHTITVAYAIFCLVILSFPYVKPVTSFNMNYVAVVYGAIALVIGIVVIHFNSGQYKGTALT